MAKTPTFSWMTPAAPAAIAVLQCQFDDENAIAGLLDRKLPGPGRARFGLLQDQRQQAVDEVVVIRQSPQVLEFQCHGGVGIRAAINNCLKAHGLTESQPLLDPEWSAFAAIAHKAALPLLSAAQEKGLDQHPLWFRKPSILLTGPSNAGKSTLLNAWCGHRRAIVSDQPGTTRDLLAAVSEHKGWEFQLFDSAGLRSGADELEQAGQALVAEARQWVDLVLNIAPVGTEHDVQTGDVLIQSKVDLPSASQLPDQNMLPWSAPEFIGSSESQQQLLAIGDQVLGRLGLEP